MPLFQVVRGCRSYLGRKSEERSTVETIDRGGAGSIQSESGSQSKRLKLNMGTTGVGEFGGTNCESHQQWSWRALIGVRLNH
jgi:hypothetical protein